MSFFVKKIVNCSAANWMETLVNVLCGDARSVQPSPNHTNDRLTSDIHNGPTVIHNGMIGAKRFALKADLVDLTQQLAEAWPSYIPASTWHRRIPEMYWGRALHVPNQAASVYE
jgi:hypothetical protein